MTSKEALERLGAEKLARGELIRNDSKVEPYIECIKQDLERLEALEKENKELNDVIEKYNHLNIQSFFIRDREREEIKQLKKIIKENFCYSPNALYDKVFFKWTGPVMEDEIIEVLGE